MREAKEAFAPLSSEKKSFARIHSHLFNGDGEKFGKIVSWVGLSSRIFAYEMNQPARVDKPETKSHKKSALLWDTRVSHFEMEKLSSGRIRVEIMGIWVQRKAAESSLWDLTSFTGTTRSHNWKLKVFCVHQTCVSLSSDAKKTTQVRQQHSSYCVKFLLLFVQLFSPNSNLAPRVKTMKTWKVNVDGWIFSSCFCHTFSPNAETLSACELSAISNFMSKHHRQHMRDDGCLWAPHGSLSRASVQE